MTDNAGDIAAIRGVTRLGDLVVDDETGEIVAIPEDIGADFLEWVGRQRAEARVQENAWKSIGAFYQKLVGGRMEGEELERYDGETVNIGQVRGRDSRWGDPKRLAALEVGPLRYKRAILAATTRLDLDVIRDLEATRRMPRGTAAEITQGKIGEPYWTVRTKRRAAQREEAARISASAVPPRGPRRRQGTSRATGCRLGARRSGSRAAGA